MFVFGYVVMFHVDVVVSVARYNRAADMMWSSMSSVFVYCVWAAWVVGVEVVFIWDRDEGAGTYTREVELGCEGRQVGSPWVAQRLGEPEVVFG